MELGQDDIDFGMLLQQKQYRELTEAIQQLTTEIGRMKSHEGSENATLAIEKLSKTLASIPKPEAPVVNVSSNNEGLADFMQSLTDQLQQHLSSVRNEKPKLWNFSVERHPSGLIKNVIAETK